MKATITEITLKGKTLYAYVVGKSDNGLIMYVQNRLIRVKDNNVEIIEDELLYISEKKKVRHDPYRTALAIFNYIVKELK